MDRDRQKDGDMMQRELPHSTNSTERSVVDVRRLGAHGDGKHVDTKPIQEAIEACHAAGGGVAYVPPGEYVTGSLVLRSNVTLYLEGGATLRGSTERSDYATGTRDDHRYDWTAGECLIYAENASHVSVRGRGVIDGNGPAFWTWNGRHWVADKWRPSMMQFLGCDHVLVEDVMLRNSPGWTLHPTDCDGVTIRGVTIRNGMREKHGPNTDGIDIDACRHVRISDCDIQSGDDSIVIKITDRAHRERVSRDIVVTNCVLATDASGLKIGSESCGEFRNITFSNCTISEAGDGIGLWVQDGGVVDGWLVSNVTMTLREGGQPFYVWSSKRTPETPRWGTVRNVVFSNIVATGDGAAFLMGPPEQPIENVTLDNVRFFMSGTVEKPLHADPPHPFDIWGHRASPYDIYSRHVGRLVLRNVELEWNRPERPEWGSAIRCRDVGNVDIDGFVGRGSEGSEAPTIDLRNVKSAFIRNCQATEGTNSFVGVGPGVERVTIVGNDLSEAKSVVELDEAATADVVFAAANRELRDSVE